MFEDVDGIYDFCFFPPFWYRTHFRAKGNPTLYLEAHQLIVLSWQYPTCYFRRCRRFSGSLPLTLHLHHQCLSLFAFWSQFNEMCSKIKTFPPSLPTADKKNGVNFMFHVQQHLGRQEKLKQCLQRRWCCMGKCKAVTMHTFTSRRSWRSSRPALTKWLLAPES